MFDYRFRIRLESPVGTPWQSDTIFGHLCWQVALGRADMTIDEFLAPFHARQPPFVLSDGFPAELLPRPMLLEKQAGGAPRDEPHSVSDYARSKRRRKARWVGVEDFLRLCRGEAASSDPPPEPWVSISMLHASLDRRNLRTGGEGGAGRLFETEARVLDSSYGNALDLYLRAQDEPWARRVELLLIEVSRAGFGRDKSVGMGAFKVYGREPFTPFSELSGNHVNGFVSLSSWVPAEGDPVKGAWRARIKRGKLGELTADSPNPFKRPVIELEPGAVFEVESPPRPWYGRLATGVSSDRPEAVQCGYTLTAPCRLIQGAG